jgi:hypothetical protein
VYGVGFCTRASEVGKRIRAIFEAQCGQPPLLSLGSCKMEFLVQRFFSVVVMVRVWVRDCAYVVIGLTGKRFGKPALCSR